VTAKYFKFHAFSCAGVNIYVHAELHAHTRTRARTHAHTHTYKSFQYTLHFMGM